MSQDYRKMREEERIRANNFNKNTRSGRFNKRRTSNKNRDTWSKIKEGNLWKKGNDGEYTNMRPYAQAMREHQKAYYGTNDDYIYFNNATPDGIRNRLATPAVASQEFEAPALVEAPAALVEAPANLATESAMGSPFPPVDETQSSSIPKRTWGQYLGWNHNKHAGNRKRGWWGGEKTKKRKTKNKRS